MTGASLEDHLSPADIEALFRPYGEAKGLPGRAYGAAFFALEQKRLFPRLWCAVAFASDMPEPGDAMPVDLAGWPLLLVRGKDRVIRAFHNICRHRAMKIVLEPCKTMSALACPWHAWTYDLGGKLVSTPRIGGERENSDPNFDTAGLDLKSVRTAQWLDLVFVNIDGRAPPFDEHMKPLNALLEAYDFSSLERAEEWSVVYPGNWKVSVEGAIEDYHLPWGHPQLLKGVRRGYPALHFARDCFYANSSAREFATTPDPGTAMAADAGFPPILRPDGDGLMRTFFMSLFPTGSFQTRANHVLQGLFLPDGPESTKVRFIHYYPGTAATDPAFAKARQEVAKAWETVFVQDVPFVRAVHENYQRRDDAGIDTRVAPFWERNVLEFQRNVVELLKD
ncbi:MAG: aromatic ring-hydroxylating dioxygenase subunit alpha [Alphaproteobacteria bacterium]